MKYIIPTTTLIFGSMMSLFADSGYSSKNDPCSNPCCTPTCCPEIVEDCCAYYRCPPTLQVTPNAGPRVNGGSNFFITADFTWWSAHEDGLAFANFESDSRLTPNGNRVPETTMAVPNFKWKPGFKVGAGYGFCHDGWDVYLDYTWFNSTNNNNSISLPNTGSGELDTDISDSYWFVNAPYIQDVLSTFPLYRIDIYEAGRANLDIKWNVLDLELGRNFYLSRRVKVRPHVGLKAMWARQTYEVEFDIQDDAGSATFATSSMHNHMRNWGIGMRAGVDTSWQFCEGFSLLAELAATGLWEQFKVHRQDQTEFFLDTSRGTFPLGTAGDIPSAVNYQSNRYFLRPVLEWFLGVRWETWTCGDGFHFEVDAGWETQLWFSQNQFLRIQCAEADHGDLSFQGLTLRARFDF